MDTRRILLIGGLGVAALIIFSVVRNLGAPQAPTEPVEPTVVETVQYADILVATQDVPFGSRLLEGMMEWKQWPQEALNEAYIQQSNEPQAILDLVGAVVRSPIYAGEPVTGQQIVKAGDKGLMAALLNPGMRAVTTPISIESAAGGFIQPGDYVDIILTSRVQDNNNAFQNIRTERFVSTTIFENVHVLAIDQQHITLPENGATILGSTATFQLSQSDAEILQQAAQQGDLTLTLRGLSESRSGYVQSAAKIKQEKNESSVISVYRNGTASQVAIRGQ